ncbi:unnamed protein product, partial [Symbiodinium sp. KB8]
MRTTPLHDVLVTSTEGAAILELSTNEDETSMSRFHIEDEYASCWTKPLHDAMMTSTEDETTSMRFLRTAQLLHPILLPFLDVNSMLMLRAICRDSVSEQAFLGHCVEISMEISSFNNLAASLSDLRRPATWKAWRCLMCVAAQPKWFGQNSSRVLDLAEAFYEHHDPTQQDLALLWLSQSFLLDTMPWFCELMNLDLEGFEQEVMTALRERDFRLMLSEAEDAAVTKRAQELCQNSIKAKHRAEGQSISWFELVDEEDDPGQPSTAASSNDVADNAE